MLLKKDIKNNVALLRIYSIATSCVFFLPVLIPYYMDEIGLTFSQFLIAEAIFAAFWVALEVPSGWLSDVWKRKNVLVIACIFDVLGYGLILIADGLTMAIIAQIMFAVNVSLISGTNSALLYDTLLEEGNEKEYGKKESSIHGFNLYTLAITCALGGFLYEWHHDAPIWAGILIQIVCFGSAMLMVEPKRHKKTVDENPIKDMITTMKFALTHAEIGMIIVLTGIIFSATKLMMWLQQPYYQAMNIPEMWFGMLMAVGFLLGGISSHLGHLITVKNITTLIIGWVIVIASCLLSGIIIWWHGVIILMLTSSLLYGWLTPRIKEAINNRVDSSRRATILSTQSLVPELLFIPLSLALAAITANASLGLGIVFLGIWTIFAGILVIIFVKIRKHNLMNL